MDFSKLRFSEVFRLILPWLSRAHDAHFVLDLAGLLECDEERANSGEIVKTKAVNTVNVFIHFPQSAINELDVSRFVVNELL